MPLSPDGALAALGANTATLTAEETAALDRDGYVLLRELIAPERLDGLRRRFEMAVLDSDQWPYPRERDIRYAKLDGDPEFLAICVAPRVLAGVHHLFQRRFFLASYEGREPRHGGGQQKLHRDCLEPFGLTHNVSLLAFLDDFGPENGATRLIPGSHAHDEAVPLSDPGEIIAEGKGGDGLLFHSRLIHSGRRNDNGAPRRTLIAAYLGYEHYEKRYFKPRLPDAADEATRYIFGASL